MAEFKLTSKMTVKELKDLFRAEFGGTLRVYDGRAQAEDNVKLSSITNGSNAEIVCRGSRTVGAFEEELKEQMGLKVQVATADDWVAVLDGITLSSISKIKNNATKADMASLLAYGAKGTVVPKEKNEDEITVNGHKIMQTLQREFSEKYEYLTLCFIIDADRGKCVNVKGIDTSKTIVNVRKKNSQEAISINSRTKVETIENYFWDQLGIACQIGICNYSGHKHYFPIGDFNQKTLNQANDWAKSVGCTKVGDKEIEEICKGTIF